MALDEGRQALSAMSTDGPRVTWDGDALPGWTLVHLREGAPYGPDPRKLQWYVEMNRRKPSPERHRERLARRSGAPPGRRRCRRAGDERRRQACRSQPPPPPRQRGVRRCAEDGAGPGAGGGGSGDGRLELVGGRRPAGGAGDGSSRCARSARPTLVWSRGPARTETRPAAVAPVGSPTGALRRSSGASTLHLLGANVSARGPGHRLLPAARHRLPSAARSRPAAR